MKEDEAAPIAELEEGVRLILTKGEKWLDDEPVYCISLLADEFICLSLEPPAIHRGL